MREVRLIPSGIPRKFEILKIAAVVAMNRDQIIHLFIGINLIEAIL